MPSLQHFLGRSRSREALRAEQLDAIAELGIFALQEREEEALLVRALEVVREVLDPDAALIGGADDAHRCVDPRAEIIAAPIPGGGRTLAAAWRDGCPSPSTARACVDAVANIVASALARIAAEQAADEAQIRAAQAHEALRLRDDFLSIASHELKTPLTSLLLQLESLLERADELAPHAARKLERATRSATRLGDLIETLLDVSRLTTGRMQLHPDDVTLDDVVTEVVERLHTEADRAGCAVTVERHASPRGHWDRLRVEQILANLLANAFKYGAGAPVTVSIDRDRKGAILQVTDHGPGIAAEDTARIFERFERAVSNDHYGGLGLGLYVAREIAEAHGGSIAVYSRPGEGSTFIVRLPAEELH
jgi:signal transduction histidine kinase